jgi:Xaa-Pro aminopeptidase
MSYTDFPTALYKARREVLAQKIRDESQGGVLILETAPEHFRNRDSDFPYRHDSDFYYLTGFTEPGSTLVMIVTAKNTHTHLFCRPKDLEREIWDGWRLGPTDAPETLGIDSADSNECIDQKMPEFLTNQETIYTRLIKSPQATGQLNSWLEKVKSLSRNGISTPHKLFNPESWIHEMRLFKDGHELKIMRAAGKIASAGHIRAMKTAKVGLAEYHLEAELLHTFRYSGAQSVAYNSIVASGPNACILHHRAGNRILQDGELCLIDAGCELDGYASDITRTFPVNGKFSGPQKAIYEIVLAAQTAAIEKTKVGHHFQEPHEAALTVLTQGLLDLDLINRNKIGGLENALEVKAYQPFYMHRTSHWLGMDVHDVGEYREFSTENPKPWRKLQPGMVLTLEPGLYIRQSADVDSKYWNIGIRIEDDALVNASDCELFSRDVPVTVTEIEYLMKHSS